MWVWGFTVADNVSSGRGQLCESGGLLWPRIWVLGEGSCVRVGGCCGRECEFWARASMWEWGFTVADNVSSGWGAVVWEWGFAVAENVSSGAGAVVWEWKCGGKGCESWVRVVVWVCEFVVAKEISSGGMCGHWVLSAFECSDHTYGSNPVRLPLDYWWHNTKEGLLSACWYACFSCWKIPVFFRSCVK